MTPAAPKPAPPIDALYPPHHAPGYGYGDAHVPPEARGYAGPASAYRGAMPPAFVPPRPAGTARPRELVGLAVFVVLADVLVYSFGDHGLAQAAFFPLAALLAVLVAKKGGPSMRLGGALGLLGLVAARLAWAGAGFATVLAVGLVFGVAVLARARGATLADVAWTSVTSALATPGRVTTALRGARGIFGKGPTKDAPRFAWRTVFVPAAALLVFAGVFLFANPVLEAWTTRLLAKIALPSPVRPIFWCLSFAAGAVLFRPALRRALQGTLGKRSHAAADDATFVEATRLTMARNTLVALNAIFLLENAVDALSLWAGRPPAGLGYTEYAHRGTAWLTFGLVLSTIVLGAIFRGAFHFDARVKTVRALAYVWAAQNLVLALGTFRRIQIYVDLSGLTSVRILGIFGTALVVTGLCLAIRMIQGKKSIGWLLHRKLDALVVFTVLFVAAPTDYVSTRWNASRILAGQYAPLLNVVQNTGDDENVPAMVKLLDHPDPIVRRGVAGLLARRPETNDLSLSALVAKRTLAESGARITELSPKDEVQGNVAALVKLSGAANEDEASFDYRSRGGARVNEF